MKSEWQEKPLTELVDFQRGLTYAKTDEVASSNNIVLRATNIDLKTNALDLSELRYISDKVSVPPTKLVKKGSILICTASGSKSHLGKVALIDDDYGFAFGGFMGMLTPRATLLPKYLFYAMTSQQYKDFIDRLADGTNINNLRFDDLSDFTVPVPPLSEQKRIVAILDQAFEAIGSANANAEKNLLNARELFESQLNAVLTFPNNVKTTETTLGNEIELQVGFAFKSAEFTEAAGDIRLLRGDNIVPGAFRWDGVKRYPARKAHTYQQFALADGDVVLAMDRPWVSAGLKRAQIQSDDLPCLLVQRTARMRGKAGVDNRFLYYVISSRQFIAHLVGNQTGLGVPHISGQQIKNFQFLKPTLPEQQKIAANLDSLWDDTRRLSGYVSRKIEAICELRNSVLNTAFKGRI